MDADPDRFLCSCCGAVRYRTVCAVCRTVVVSSRADVRTCSALCRQRLHRRESRP